MLRCDVIDTMYHLIERTGVEIEDILNNCNMSCPDTVCPLSEHVDNLKDAMIILEKIYDHEGIFLMGHLYEDCGGMGGTRSSSSSTTMTHTHESTSDNNKPVVVKK